MLWLRAGCWMMGDSPGFSKTAIFAVAIIVTKNAASIAVIVDNSNGAAGLRRDAALAERQDWTTGAFPEVL